MRSIFVIIFTFIGFSLIAQKPIPTTENFTIEGKVKKEMSISLADLSSYKTYSIDSIVITNHLGERRSTLKNVKGILLKDILGKIEIDAEAPKVLSEYYFVCIASDNYKVVFPGMKFLTTRQARLFTYLQDMMENQHQHWITGSHLFHRKMK